MPRKVYFKKYKLNEDVDIPPELSDQYLSVKEQIIDKQQKIVDAEEEMQTASAKVSQLKGEIAIYQKNLIAIENKAKSINQEMESTNDEDKQGFEKTAEEIQKSAQSVIDAVNTSGNSPSNESINIDDWWRKNVTESINEEDMDGPYETDEVEDAVEAEETEDALEVEDALEGDYVFTLRILDEDEEEDIIAKFYKDEDDDFWKARVVQGSEEPIESMQFDPDLDKIDIMEHLATMFDEVEEMDTDEYKGLLDDKEVIDQAFYDEDEL